MPMFLRKIVHWLYVSLMKLLVNFGPSARHQAFVGSGSSGQLSQHIILSGGKRLRPMLVMLAAQSCQYQGEQDALLASRNAASAR